MYDAVVVGGGPAGLSAALWLARHRCSVALVDSGEYRNRWVDESHGYLGFDPVEPSELLARAREQLIEYPGVEIVEARAHSASRDEAGHFTVDAGSQRLETRRIVLATGVTDAFPEVDNFLEHYGRSAFHCPTCDGYEAKDKRIVAFGWSEDLVGFALKLNGWASQVTVVTDGRRFEGDGECRETLNGCGIAIIEDDAVELMGERGDLKGVRLRGGDVLECELVFFSIAHEQNSGLADQLGCRRTSQEDDCVEVDEHGMTSVPGVYAAGDLVPGLQLIQVAAAKGTVAGVACAQSLWAEKGRVVLSPEG